MTLPFALLDVFTDRAYAGNGLAVVLDAGALNTAQMQAMAREFNQSETIFVRPPADPAHRAHVRIFFPSGEIPFAGHPTIGCACLLAGLDQGPGDWDVTLTLEEVAGLVPVRVWRRAGITRAELTAPVLPHAAPQPADPGLVARALGLVTADLALPGHRPGVFAGGPAFLFVPVADLAALSRATPQEPHWSHLMAEARVDSAYLHTPGQDCDWRARMFSPTAGIPEDPATGSATAIFAAALLAAGALPIGTTQLTLHQGVEMGRPSVLHLSADVGPGGLTAVRVCGAAVQVAQGHISPPT